MISSLDFEIPIRDLETKIEELRHLPTTANLNIAEEIANLQGKVDKLLRATYGKLTPWQKVQVARHIDRPHCRHYIDALFTEFTPLAGDRLFGEDRAIIGGLARFRGTAVMVMGTEKGSDTDERVRHNFGMARPEGYRKVRRMMELAERFRMPVITLVDTAGAFPGADAEARGQAEAIARAIETSVGLTVPLVATIIGEGGSGGAIALATGNSVLMLEHAVYSVISPEGCASILWRGGDQAAIAAAAASAAEAMRITAQDLLKMQIIDRVVPEPMGGAHRDPKKMFETLGDAIEAALNPLLVRPPAELKRQRREKFLAMGAHGI